MIEQRIFKTLRLFGLQGMSVTLLELYDYLIVTGDNGENSTNISIGSLANVLQDLVRDNKLLSFQGYYTLPEYGSIIESRWVGHRYGVVRENLIRSYAPMLRFVPFVRGVALAGSQALGLEKKVSDIDLFIITAPGFLWLPRTAVTFVLQLFGVRRHGQYIADRFCLNHYLSGVRVATGQNIYTAFEYAKLRPLVYGNYVAEFQRSNIKWIQNTFPNFKPLTSAFVSQSKLQKMFELVFRNRLGNMLESSLASLERKRIKTDEFVVVKDDELSFHPNSKQEKLLFEFNKFQ